MKRPVATKTPKGQKVSISDKGFQSKYPTLVDYMTDATWDDGKPREVSTLSINLSSGEVSLGLSDHALQCSAYTVAETLDEALGLLEGALADGRPIWRPWKAQRGK